MKTSDQLVIAVAALVILTRTGLWVLGASLEVWRQQRDRRAETSNASA